MITQKHHAITQTYSNELLIKEVMIQPKFNGEHRFEPATYSYSFEKSDIAERYYGYSSNKPNHVEILTTREYILTSSWHAVSCGD
jgi:hypothetical protein